MSIALRKYIESSQKVKCVLIQTKIDEELAEDFRKVCERNGWKMTEAVRAGIRKLVDDESEKTKPAGVFQLPRTLDPENKSSWK